MRYIFILIAILMVGCYPPCNLDSGLSVNSKQLYKNDVIGSYALMDKSIEMISDLGYKEEFTVIVLREDKTLNFQSYPNLALEMIVDKPEYVEGTGSWNLTFDPDEKRNRLSLKFKGFGGGRQGEIVYKNWWDDPIFFIEFYDPDYCYALYFEKI